VFLQIYYFDLALAALLSVNITLMAGAWLAFILRKIALMESF
jgi:hypothetical protein